MLAQILEVIDTASACASETRNDERGGSIALQIPQRHRRSLRCSTAARSVSASDHLRFSLTAACSTRDIRGRKYPCVRAQILVARQFLCDDRIACVLGGPRAKLCA